MGSYSIQYTDESLQDLMAIHDYISTDLKSPGVAAAQLKRIRDEIRSLSMFPKRYKAVEWEPWKSRGMHQMTVDHFIVFYVADDRRTTVQIIRILYGKRDIPNLVKNCEQ